MLKAALAGAAFAAALGGSLIGGAHAADEGQPAPPGQPIALKMQAGTDSITVQGVLSEKGDCCTYVFEARAGQQLYWSETGGVVRMVLTAPNGDVAGPGLFKPMPLPVTGAYTLEIQPDLMADDAFGHFTLTLRIPPRR